MPIKAFRSLRSTTESLLTVQRMTGKSIGKQLREIADLRRRTPNFGVADYFDYRLFENPFLKGNEEAHVAGWRMLHWLDDALNPTFWRGLVRDKLNFHANMSVLDIDVPRLICIYQPDGRLFGSVPTYKTPEAISDFLRDASVYPLFSKPIQGGVGNGANALWAYDAQTDELVLGAGGRISVSEFVADLDKPVRMMPRRSGYVFEECIEQAPSLVQMCGEATSTVRMIVLITDSGPVAFRAIWRIVVGDNITDNFDRGRSGNLLGGLDIETGQLTRVTRGYGLHQEIISHHPDTGESFSGFTMPDWDASVSLALKAACAFPMLRFQHLDIAFSRSGPVIVEINTTGSIDMVQYATGVGLLDPQLRQAIKSATAEAQ